MCLARQIGWLINVKIDLEHKPLHRYNFAVIAAIYTQQSARKSDSYNYLYQYNTLGTFSLISNYKKLTQHMGIDQP